MTAVRVMGVLLAFVFEIRQADLFAGSQSSVSCSNRLSRASRKPGSTEPPSRANDANAQASSSLTTLAGSTPVSRTSSPWNL